MALKKGKNQGMGAYKDSKKMSGKKASDGRVTTKKASIDPNPAGRTVPMANPGKSHGSKKKSVY